MAEELDKAKKDLEAKDTLIRFAASFFFEAHDGTADVGTARGSSHRHREVNCNWLGHGLVPNWWTSWRSKGGVDLRC